MLIKVTNWKISMKSEKGNRWLNNIANISLTSRLYKKARCFSASISGEREYARKSKNTLINTYNLVHVSILMHHKLCNVATNTLWQQILKTACHRKLILQVQANKLIFIIMSITVLMVFWQNPEYLFDCNFQEMAD